MIELGQLMIRACRQQRAVTFCYKAFYSPAILPQFRPVFPSTLPQRALWCRSLLATPTLGGISLLHRQSFSVRRLADVARKDDYPEERLPDSNGKKDPKASLPPAKARNLKSRLLEDIQPSKAVPRPPLKDAYRDSASAAKAKRRTETSKEEAELMDSNSGDPPREGAPGRAKRLSPRLVEESEHKIMASDIPLSTLRVMMTIRAAGHEGYIVGGAVRDLLLGGKPKDFDIVTSASPQQAKRLFPYGMIIGRRHPIVKFNNGDLVIEISSFGTGSQTELPADSSALLRQREYTRRPDRSEQNWRWRGFDPAKPRDREEIEASGMLESESREDPTTTEPLWCNARMQNALERDFTVNALMYDPFSRIVFDYTNGIKDCRRRRLNFIIDPLTSMTVDPARGLRAIRLAARVGLDFDYGAKKAIKESGDLLLTLNQSRLQTEMDSMMSCGAATNSIKLLWSLNLLEYFFPPLDEVLKSMRYPRSKSVKEVAYGKESLFRVLDCMDASAKPEAPLPSFVWPAVLIGCTAHLRNTSVSSQKGSSEGPQKGNREESADEDKSQPSELHAEGSESSELQSSIFESQEHWRTTLKDFLDAKLNPIPKAQIPYIMRMLETAANEGVSREMSFKCKGCNKSMKIAPSSGQTRCKCGKPLPAVFRKSVFNTAGQIVRNSLQQWC